MRQASARWTAGLAWKHCRPNRHFAAYHFRKSLAILWPWVIEGGGASISLIQGQTEEAVESAAYIAQDRSWRGKPQRKLVARMSSQGLEN